MHSVDSHTTFVNDQIRFHKRKASEFANSKNSRRSDLHKETAEKFQLLLDDFLRLVEDYQELYSKKDVSTTEKPVQLQLMPSDLDGLPQELIDELSVTKADKLEFSIIKIIENKGGMISLDHLLIDLYKETGEIFKRQSLTSKLYRMIQKELVHSVPNKKGVYALGGSAGQDGEQGDLTDDELEQVFFEEIAEKLSK